MTNYLDDFLFVALTLLRCNFLIQQFLNLCEQIGVPIALEKTEWGTLRIVFLGILLDGVGLTLAIPLEKKIRALNLLNSMISHKKATVKELQTLCGYLNFLNKAIFPGRVFVRRMYAKFGKIMCIPQITSGNHHDHEAHQGSESSFKLKSHHHVRLDGEFKSDCRVWTNFLDSDNESIVNRPMIDVLEPDCTSWQIQFSSDASAGPELGFGCVLSTRWFNKMWEPGFIKNQASSIEFLELYALCAGILT